MIYLYVERASVYLPRDVENDFACFPVIRATKRGFNTETGDANATTTQLTNKASNNTFFDSFIGRKCTLYSLLTVYELRNR